MINFMRWNLDNIDEVDNFLGRNRFLKLTHEKTENLNTTVTNKEIELVIKYLCTRKTQDHMSS